MERLEDLLFLSKRVSQPFDSQLRTCLNASTNDSCECQVIHVLVNWHVSIGIGDKAA